MLSKKSRLKKSLDSPEASIRVGLKRPYILARYTLKPSVGLIGIPNTLRAISKGSLRSEEEIVVKNKNHLRYPITITVLNSDMTTYSEIVRKEVYKLPADLVSRINGRPIVDIGANLGISAAYFATHYPDSPVLAVEPHHRNHKLLEFNSQPYEGQIVTENAAFTPRRGLVGVIDRVPNIHNYVSYSFSAEYPTSSDETMDIPAITPQEILDRLGRVALLKIDIEGAEKVVFESDTINSLLRNTELMLIEAHDRFVPGCSEAVDKAATKNGLVRKQLNQHSTVYIRI